MEIKEAIKIINQYDMNFHWNDGEPIPAEQLAEAFDLAISALEFKGRYDPVLGRGKSGRHEGKRNGDTSQRKGVQNQGDCAVNTNEAIQKIKRVKGLYAYESDYEALDMAIAALEKQEQDRWIPVKENPKKPERIFDTYQVYTKYERFGIVDYFGGGGWSGYDVDGDQIDELKIAAWRPLPEPYQEDEA